MPIDIGTRLGPYEVLASIGAGGMGQVYRARDTTLGREVAIKILPEAFATDPERVARFQREAKTLASLNHPHIAAIYGFEKSAGVPALVMELVEGEDLSQRIARGPIPLDEALPIAKQIAEALEAAHEQGIVHRDLKPANIKLKVRGAPPSRTEDGCLERRLSAADVTDCTVKVLDFGLAKALQGPAAAADLSQSPTLSMAATQAGVILGTAAYMSPEQAKGKAVDRRSDIWAFGCVLYEMLTGQRAFSGEDVTDTLAFIITREPDWAALPSNAPAAISKLVRRCLEKDRKRRLADIADARIEIEETLQAPPGDTARTVSPTIVRPKSQWRRIGILTAGALAVATLGGAAMWLTMRPTPPRVVRLNITPSSAAALSVNGVERDLAIAPDGSRVAYVGNKSTQVFVRALDQLEAAPLSGLGSAPRGLFFSADGAWIGFFDGFNTLKKASISGGPAVTLGRLGAGSRGATWGQDDTIIFATNSRADGLWRVSAAGGEPSVLTTPNREREEGDHLWPEFLPDARAVLFTIVSTTGGIGNAQVAVLDLRTGEQKILVRGGSHAHYVASGHLVYAAAGTLLAVAFDLDRLEAEGTPVPVLSQVLTTPEGGADFDVAGDGTLVYVPGGTQAIARTLVWVDRQGRETPIKAPIRAYTYPRLSPDGQRVALDVRDQEFDIWIWNLVRETPTRFTFDPGQDRYPVWTPDRLRLVFSSSRAGARNVFWQAADGTGAVDRLSESPNTQDPQAISPDGTQLVFTEQFPKTGWDLMVLTLDKQPEALPSSRGVGEPGRSSKGDVRPLVQTAFDELNAEISPDGRWLAYQSNESGQDEIYVRPFPDVGGGRWQVSAGGGTRPLWARSGQEIFYQHPTSALMGVRIELAASFTAAAVTKLFDGPYFGTGANSGRSYDVSPDGQRFLMIKTGGGFDQTATPPTLVVVQNWLEELKRLVPAK